MLPEEISTLRADLSQERRKVRNLKQQLDVSSTEKDNTIKLLKKQLKDLRRRNNVQTAVIDTVEEINRILSEDEQGKQMVWTTNFPHNLKPEISEKIQGVLKKRSTSGDGSTN